MQVEDTVKKYYQGYCHFLKQILKNTIFHKAVGCEKCYNTGYKGRVAIMEALYFSKEIKRIILQSGGEIDEELIKETAVKSGMLTLRASGRERIKNGDTTVEEIMAITVDD